MLVESAAHIAWAEPGLATTNHLVPLAAIIDHGRVISFNGEKGLTFAAASDAAD